MKAKEKQIYINTKQGPFSRRGQRPLFFVPFFGRTAQRRTS